MESLLSEILKLGISGNPANNGEFKQLTLKQVKIYGVDGNVKTLYPSKVDLNYAANEGIAVERL